MVSKNIILVGGSGLIGEGIYKFLKERDYSVIVADKFRSSSVREEDFYEVNLARNGSARELVAYVKTELSSVAAMINCSYPRTEAFNKDLREMDEQSFNENISLHVGVFYSLSREFGLFFEQQGHGSVLNFSSIYGSLLPRFEVYAGTDMRTGIVYTVVKSSIEKLTCYMAKYFLKSGIRFNTLSPGGIANGQDSSFCKRYNEHAGSKGMLDVQDLTGAVEFLISDSSRYITGQNIIVDDGFSL